MSKQMTKKDAIDLMAHFMLIAQSKQGNQLLEKHMGDGQIDKMMQVVVSLFKGENEKAEQFIINRIEVLLKKLDAHKIPENSRKYFEKGDE